MAAQYELGAVDQLARSSAWHAEGRRFESDQLHSLTGPNHIGSEELRRRLGPITHRAAAGETFHVTRRGKPFVTLSSAENADPANEEGRETHLSDLEEA